MLLLLDYLRLSPTWVLSLLLGSLPYFQILLRSKHQNLILSLFAPQLLHHCSTWKHQSLKCQLDWLLWSRLDLLLWFQLDLLQCSGMWKRLLRFQSSGNLTNLAKGKINKTET